MNGLMASMLIAMTTICTQFQDASRTTEDTDRGLRPAIWDLDIDRIEFQKVLDNPIEPQTWEASPPQAALGRVAGVRLKIEGAPNQPDRTKLPSGASLVGAKSLNQSNRIYFNELDIAALRDGGANFGVAIPEELRQVESYQIIYRPTQAFQEQLEREAQLRNSDSRRDSEFAIPRRDESQFGSGATDPLAASRQSQSNMFRDNNSDLNNRNGWSNPNEFVGPRQQATNWDSLNASRNSGADRTGANSWPDRRDQPGNSAVDQLELDGGFQRPRRATNDVSNFGRQANETLAPIRRPGNQADDRFLADRDLRSQPQDDPALVEALRKKEETQRDLQRLREQKRRQLAAIEKRKLEEETEALQRQKFREEWEMEQRQKDLLRQSSLVNNGYDKTGMVDPSRMTPSQSITATRDRMAFNPTLDRFAQNYVGRQATTPPNRVASLDDVPTEPFSPSNIAPPLVQVKAPSEETSGRAGNQKNGNSIAGNRKAIDADGKGDTQTAFLLLMFLLCSIGLNFFLAWISRGFYVRYNDLADELRDTFNATSV